MATLAGIDSTTGNMFVSRPPCTALRLAIGANPSTAIKATIHDAHGITISLITETFKKMLQSFEGERVMLRSSKKECTTDVVRLYAEFTVNDLERNSQ